MPPKKQEEPKNTGQAAVRNPEEASKVPSTSAHKPAKNSSRDRKGSSAPVNKLQEHKEHTSCKDPTETSKVTTTQKPTKESSTKESSSVALQKPEEENTGKAGKEAKDAHASKEPSVKKPKDGKEQGANEKKRSKQSTDLEEADVPRKRNTAASNKAASSTDPAPHMKKRMQKQEKKNKEENKNKKEHKLDDQAKPMHRLRGKSNLEDWAYEFNSGSLKLDIRDSGLEMIMHACMLRIRV